MKEETKIPEIKKELTDVDKIRFQQYARHAGGFRLPPKAFTKLKRAIAKAPQEEKAAITFKLNKMALEREIMAERSKLRNRKKNKLARKARKLQRK